MHLRSGALPLVIGLLALPTLTAAQTPVSGTITTTTWTAASGPYRVADTITVPAGETLTIEPGVDVLFDADVPFFVEGRLQAVGTATDSIRFIAGDTTEWGGIRISGADSSTFEYAQVSNGHSDGGGGGIRVAGSGTRLQLAHVMIRGNAADLAGGGVQVADTAAATVTDVTISGNTAGTRGGGMDVDSSSTATVTESTIRANEAEGDGGGLAVDDSSGVVVSNTAMDGNESFWNDGGGLYVGHAATARLVNCTINDNITDDYGGGVAIEGGESVTLSDCTINGNYADDDEGGGIYIRNTGDTGSVGVTLENCDISNNITDWDDGGGISIESASVTLTNCTINDNDADDNGGGLDIYDAVATLTGCVISGNSGWNGGGLVVSNATVTLTNSIVANNSGYRGGGLYTWRGTVTLTNTTVTGNTGNTGGGLYVGTDSADTTVTLLNSILWNDTPQEVFNNSTFPDIIAATYSDIQDGYPGVGNINTDPLFADAAGSDYTLRISSPCINTGDPAGPRDPDGSIADMGAFPARVLYGDASADGTVTAFDAALVLQSLVGLAPEPMLIPADVTANGFVSALDAALILRKMVNPDYLFPVEGGALSKPASGSPRTLAWVHDASGWALVVDDPTRIEAGQVRFVMRRDVPVRLSGGDLLSSSQQQRTVRVAFARAASSDTVLFRIESDEPLADAPVVAEARLNEGLISVARVVRPIRFALDQNVPNPFNPTTTLRFATPTKGIVNLAIYDVNGRLVRTLVSGAVDAGAHEVVWDGTDGQGRAVSSGAYLYRLTSGEGTVVRKMVLLR